MTTLDLGTVDFLARLRLRTGARLVRAPRELWELLDLCGLVEVVGQGLEVAAAKPPSPGRQSRGQAEQWEQPLRVEEERQLDDPAL
jgi:hypothetical protein